MSEGIAKTLGDKVTMIQAGCGLAVQLRWQGDRFSHVIGFDAASGLVPLWESVEGSPDDAWPTCPPLQQSHEAATDGQRCFLFVGMAGSSHWSVSIELQPEPGRLTVDVACRMRTVSEWLGSTYRVLIPAFVNPHEKLSDAMHWRDPAGDLWQLELPALDGQAAACAALAGDWLTIRPAQVSSQLPQTVRWKYALLRGAALSAAQT